MRLFCARGHVVDNAALPQVVFTAKAAAIQELHCPLAPQLLSAPQLLCTVGAVPQPASPPSLGSFRSHVCLLCACEQAVKDAALSWVVFTAKAAAVQESRGLPTWQFLSAHRGLSAAGAAPARVPQPRLWRLGSLLHLLCARKDIVEDAALPRVFFTTTAAAV